VEEALFVGLGRLGELALPYIHSCAGAGSEEQQDGQRKYVSKLGGPAIFFQSILSSRKKFTFKRSVWERTEKFILSSRMLISTRRSKTFPKFDLDTNL
jgi:hypothetical protein